MTRAASVRTRLRSKAAVPNGAYAVAEQAAVPNGPCLLVPNGPCPPAR